MDIRLKLILFILLFAFQCLAQVDQNKFEELVQRADRPTVLEVLAALSIKPGQQVFVEADDKTQKRLEELKNKILNNLPNLVVSLEYFYPNGRYAFLGRDASGAADVLEAFYLSIGQRDRVFRLRSSGNSMTGPEFQRDPQRMMADFLRTNGAPLDSQDLESERPFVIVDATSLSPNSQSTLLATAGVNELKARGYKDEQIYPKLAVADISNRDVIEFKDRKTLLELQTRQRGNAEYYTAGSTLYNGTILSHLAVDFSYAKLQPLWHDTFRPLSYVGHQKVAAKPGDLLKESDRSRSIKNILMINQLMLDRDILIAVQQEAKKREIGFYKKNLNLKVRLKTEINRPPPVSAVHLYRAMLDVFQANEKARAAGVLTSVTNSDLIKYLQQKYSNEANFQYAFLSLLLTAYNNQKLSLVDLSRALFKAYDFEKLMIDPNETFAKYFYEKMSVRPDLLKAVHFSQFLAQPDKVAEHLVSNGEVVIVEELYTHFGEEKYNTAAPPTQYGKLILNAVVEDSSLKKYFDSLKISAASELQKNIMTAVSGYKKLNEIADILLSFPSSVYRDEFINIFLRNNHQFVFRMLITQGQRWSDMVKVADLDTLKILIKSFKYGHKFETYENPKLVLLQEALQYGLDSKRNRILEKGFKRLQNGNSFSCKSLVSSVKAIFVSK